MVGWEAARTVKRVPEENLASVKATADFVNPFVVECHPFWLDCYIGWLDILPESGGLHIFTAFYDQTLLSKNA
jgi:hypothetical protein